MHLKPEHRAALDAWREALMDARRPPVPREERAADHRRASREYRDVLGAVRRQLSEIRSLHRRALEQHRVWLALLERFFRRAAAPPR